MKQSDIEKIHAAGLISSEQRLQIIERFQLREEGGKFLAIISFIGGILIIGGLILLIASNWTEIPPAIKIAVGVFLMLGTHLCGYYLRDVRQDHVKTAEALHLIGSVLFLGNIGLIGQIYHLSTRPPNAFLLWWLGIAALPWLLRSIPQHILSLAAFGVWFGMEVNQPGSWLFFGRGEYQILVYALLGLIFLGLGYCLRGTSFADFGPVTGRFGLLVFHIFAFPLTWGLFFRGSEVLPASCTPVFLGLGSIAVILVACGLNREVQLTRQWRWTWGLSILGVIGLLALGFFFPWIGDASYSRDWWYHWVASVALFVFCLLQIQVGLQMRSSYAVNLAVAAIALNIIATYLSLIGSMARTGAMFLVSGIFLVVFGIYLEKKRRALLHKMNAVI